MIINASPFYRFTAWNTGTIVTITVTRLRDGRRAMACFPAAEDSPKRRAAEASRLYQCLEAADAADETTRTNERHRMTI